MRTGESPQTHNLDAAYEQVLNAIYALLDDDDKLPELLHAVDSLFSATDPHIAESDTSARISSLVPHVQRANDLLEKISEIHLKNSHTGKVLDHVPMGIILITTEADIVFSNARASALLDHIGAEHHQGVLRFRDACHQSAFDLAMQDIGSGNKRGAAVKMGDLNLWISHYGEGKGNRLAVYLGHQTFRRNVRANLLMAEYQLTEKEAMLTAELCNGHADLEEAAVLLGINISTARTHLKRIFAKTGAQRQADLVKMVLINPILTVQ